MLKTTKMMIHTDHCDHCDMSLHQLHLRQNGYSTSVLCCCCCCCCWVGGVGGGHHGEQEEGDREQLEGRKEDHLGAGMPHKHCYKRPQTVKISRGPELLTSVCKCTLICTHVNPHVTSKSKHLTRWNIIGAEFILCLHCIRAPSKRGRYNWKSIPDAQFISPDLAAINAINSAIKGLKRSR